MAIPKQDELYNIILESLKDGNVHDLDDIRRHVKCNVNMTRSESMKMLASGRELVWHNRVGWSLKYLREAELISRPKKSHYQITESGKKILMEGTILNKPLIEKMIAGLKNMHNNDATEDDQLTLDEIEAPSDAFDRMYREINDSLADELMDAILARSSDFFERLVVRLMESMGYGGYEGAGFVTKSSRDGGIDGIIYEDKLGFNLIYVQAKCWGLDKVIGKPEIQKFVGALAGPPKIEKGLFITTARFSEEAQKYAKDQRIILVDGKKLTELMIEFDVGVSTQKIYRIKRVDKDFFTG